MTQDQSLANHPVEEVKATFFRIFKIWWSMIWRGFLIVVALRGLHFMAQYALWKLHCMDGSACN